MSLPQQEGDDKVFEEEAKDTVANDADDDKDQQPPQPPQSTHDPLILHVLCVSFHHRYGPQVDLSLPPFPPIVVDAVSTPHARSASTQSTSLPAVPLPAEWSFLPFLCLPDGAHASEEEFIYFHLPPVPAWCNQGSTGSQQSTTSTIPSTTTTPFSPYSSTVFGLACYRQIPASELINKTADVTRSTVQKAVVVLASKPFLGSVRSKLGMVTQAFFAQKDFSKLDILETLHESLLAMVPVSGHLPDSSLYMGISLRDLIYKFRQKTLQLFKLLLLGKRVLFFGQKVERLTCYQYSLVSLVPLLLRNLKDVGAASLNSGGGGGSRSASLTNLASIDPLTTGKVKSFNMPLQLFGQGSVWLPYIPLQQIDVLLSPETKSFFVGTSNSIFTHHSACNIDAVVNTDTGAIEIQDSILNSALILTPPDKKFIDEITKTVVSTWSEQENDPTMNLQMEFEGSDDDIRAKFETYLLSLLLCSRIMSEPPPQSSITATLNNSLGSSGGGSVVAAAGEVKQQQASLSKLNLLQDYNINFAKLWHQSSAYKTWLEETTLDSLKQQPQQQEGAAASSSLDFLVPPSHPFQGVTTLGAMQQSISSKLSEFGKTVSSVAGPTANSTAVMVQANVGKALVGAESGLKAVASVVSDPNQRQAATTSLIAGIGSWYAQKKKEWGSSASPAEKTPSEMNVAQKENEEVFEHIDLNKDD